MTYGVRVLCAWSRKVKSVEVARGVVDAVDEKRRARLIDDPVGLEGEETHWAALDVRVQPAHLRKLR